MFYDYVLYVFYKNVHFCIIFWVREIEIEIGKKKEVKEARNEIHKNTKRDFIILSFRIHINIEVSRIFPYSTKNT